MSAAQDRPKSRPATPSYRDNFDRIFGRKADAPPIHEDILDDAAFYNLMQNYRHAKDSEVVMALQVVKAYIRGLTV